jgi:hypothetical protein
MKALTDGDLMPFGAHKGKKMEDVPAHYLDWCSGQAWIDSWPQVKAYIEANETVIEQELREQGRLD